MKKISVLGTRFDDISIPEAVEAALQLMAEKKGSYVVTPNPEIVLAGRKNRKLAGALRGAALSLPDGVGVVLASRILGTPITNRVPGIDFATALLSRMSDRGMSVFLLGAEEGVAETAADRLSERFPGLRILGTNDGYFSEYDEGPLLERINEAEPDLLTVCLGSPKQELWMRTNRDHLRVGLMAGLGGTLDVWAGVTKRAPRKWRRLGLEWLYRLIREPRRIVRMIRLPGILLAALWYRIGGK